MKRQKYTLKIDSPCHQDWSSMTQNETGKFCGHCSKTVIDFSALTDAEIVKIINNRSNNLCGRFTNEQLDRQIQSIEHSTTPSFHKILAGLLLMASSGNAEAKAVKPAIEITAKSNDTISSLQEKNERQNEPLISDTSITINGKLIDAETEMPISFTVVTIKNNNAIAVTDSNGMFKIAIPDSLEKIVLSISPNGYRTAEYTIDKKNINKGNQVTLFHIQRYLMGKVLIKREDKHAHKKKKAIPVVTQDSLMVPVQQPYTTGIIAIRKEK